MKCKEIKIGDVMDALIKMCGEPVYKVIGDDSQGNQISSTNVLFASNNKIDRRNKRWRTH